MHSQSMKVTTTDLKTYVQTMVDLLEDPITLLQDPAAVQAVTDIKLIETTTVEVNDTSFLGHEHKVWKTHLASLSADNKKEILKLVKNNDKLENRIQNVETDVALLKDETKRLNDVTVEVQQQVKEIEERLVETTDEVKLQEK
ncbi:hypothetical protein NP493_348g03075 [Ridgeia piscesae]|uniref:Uncharacterized protein n=1 Tax=Ridgeia piscesae TaxID=27915 RepID=A0AAD9L3I1_RIDPI|nr:hypothetical protein NP493_348g03075 [Ridgeia piscesae]